MTANSHNETSQNLQNTVVKLTNDPTSMRFILRTIFCSERISLRKFTFSSTHINTLLKQNHSKDNHAT